MKHACSLVCAVSLLWISSASAAMEIASPDGRLVVAVDTDDRGIPRYRASFDGQTVILPSRLGLRFSDRAGFDSGFRIADSKRAARDRSWEQPWGERRLVADRHRELLVKYRSTVPPKRRFNIRFRVFDDGFGFRYELPRQAEYADIAIVDELTEFHVPANSTAWWIPARRFNRYEYLYRTTNLESIAEAHTPMTLRLPSGVHMSIHEAALVDYAAYVLDQRRAGVFETDLTPWSDGIRVRATTPFVTPWRTVQVSQQATGLLNSSLILNLNEPSKLDDVSWIEPGKYAGIWWAMHIGERTWGSGEAHGATTGEAKRYIDFAARHGFAGVLIEGWNIGWDGDWYNNGDLFDFSKPYADFDIHEVTEYGRSKGVRLVGHHETSGSVTNYEKQMDAAFALYEATGVRQVKTGYVADAGDIKRVDEAGVAHYEWHDGQFMVRHYQQVVEKAAKYKISINTHEPIKDTGLRRTWPNWISREGARGQEFNAWGEPPNPPEHTAIIPYTRLLAGPMDFTPGIFDLTFEGPESPHRVQTTLAKQLALYVVIYSPIQMVADLPRNYDKHPDAFQFIVDVPTDWEESIALAGEVGDFVVFARRERGGGDWYLGAVSDEEARAVSVSLDFLDGGQTYFAEIYRDGDDAHWRTNPYAIEIERRKVTGNDVLELPLAAGGGMAVRFTPQP